MTAFSPQAAFSPTRTHMNPTPKEVPHAHA